jgi:hypothetical protein
MLTGEVGQFLNSVLKFAMNIAASKPIHDAV